MTPPDQEVPQRIRDLPLSQANCVNAVGSWLRRSGDAGNRGPSLKGLDPGGLMLDGWNLVAAEQEEVVDPVVGGQEPLRLTG